MNWRFKDLTGQKFGRWTAISTNFKKNKFGYCLWLCKCECGTLREVSTQNLKSGSSMSCGCLTRDKAKLGLSRKGRSGQKLSEESRLNISNGLRGRKVTNETRRKLREAHLGKVRPAISEALRGKPKLSIRGEKHYKWIKDRNEALDKHRIRSSSEWKRWRESVFMRDSFTCKDCGVTGVYIEPHHIVPVRSDKSKLFDTNNGITLCRPCHQKTVMREEEFADRYIAILTK